MTRFLIQLHHATSDAPVEGHDSGTATSMATLRFVRADVDEWVRTEFASLPVMGEGTGGGGAQWGEECMDALECVRRKLGTFEDSMLEDADDGHV